MLRPLLLILALIATPTAVGAASRSYAMEGDCGGRPMTSVRMAPGYCLGLVWQGAGTDGPRMPRGLLPLGDGETNGDWLVTDLGGWDPGRGAVWRLSFGPDGAARWRRLAQGLSMPHTVARGPDGRIYVSEMNRILTLDPDAADPAATVRTVIGDLPDNRLHDNRHPLSSFVFDGDGALLVNVGAPSDRCVDARGRARTDARGACADSANTAQVRRHAYLGNGRWAEESTVFASGLRNSIALVRHRSGTILQGENSVDLTTPDHPYDEINVLRRGGHYGWPYCVDLATPLPGWSAAQARCGERERPVALLPPHAAPLDLIYYEGAMFPELRGRLLMSWHGYRRAGGRIVAAETDVQGRPLTDIGGRYAIYPRGSLAYPAGAPSIRGKVLTPGWDTITGRQPRGSPVVMAVAADGSIWVTDDRSRAILRIARPTAP